MARICFISLVLILFTHVGLAQMSDSLGRNQKDVTEKVHSPKKAAIMSAILPGLGQVYNKQYWKPIVIYGGAAGLIYMFNQNQKNFTNYRDAYIARTDNDAGTIDQYVGEYSDNNLFTLQKFYRRYRDLAVIGGSLLYLLNIVDASVSAHLFTFDVSDDLSLNISPSLNYDSFAQRDRFGVALKLKF